MTIVNVIYFAASFTYGVENLACGNNGLDDVGEILMHGWDETFNAEYLVESPPPP